MAEIITMPRLSDTMTEGVLANWLKKVGDKINEGDILAEIETDKATMEFESFNEGTLLYIGLQNGESAPVDTLLAIIGEEGEDVETILKNAGKQAEKTTATEPQKEEAQPAANQNTPKDSAKTESVVSDGSLDTNTFDASNSRLIASPLAKKLAREKGIDLSNIQGTGDHGRVIKRDIEGYKASNSIVSIENTANSSQKESYIAQENSQMRKTIAKRLIESKHKAPHYYLTSEINMDDAIASRKLINELPDTKVSFNDLVLKATALALTKHPAVNSEWKEEKTLFNQHVNIGVAVAIEDGLVVPVVKFANTKSMTEIGKEVKELALKAKSKKLSVSEMTGSTFTISNLGMFGISEFTSIINQPNSAILSVGAIEQKPVVKNGEVVVGSVMKVTLACDHRTIDGATGAKFLQTLKSYIENPIRMLA
jgi:pyruvate dehydrogenase E2 component (dihydrolipoamide acetyltransferase)